DPTQRVAGASRPFQVTWLDSKKFEEQPGDYLKDFAAVFLLNVPSLSDPAWNRLHLYLNRGGGLVVALGDLADPKNYNDPMAAATLPATIEPSSPPKYDKTAFGDGDWNHPILGQFREELPKNLSGVPVYRHAALKVKEGAHAVLEFQDKSPALVERSF